MSSSSATFVTRQTSALSTTSVTAAAASSSSSNEPALPSASSSTAASPSTVPSTSDAHRDRNNDAISPQACFYMTMLAIQTGIQPMLYRTYAPDDINGSSVILVQETFKFIIASAMLVTSGNWDKAVAGWSIKSWLGVAGVPAALFSVQGYCNLIANRTLDGITFVVLNQTKTMSAALCCYILLGRKQTKMQIVALLLLLCSALVMEGVIKMDHVFPSFAFGFGSTDLNNAETIELKQMGENYDEANVAAAETAPMTNDVDVVDVASTVSAARHLTRGVLPALIASFISGLAAAITQKNLQRQSGSRSGGGGGGRDVYLFTMELCVASVCILSTSLLFSADGTKIATDGFFDKWTVQTFIPISTIAAAGPVVGLVTKHAGAVRKGFALIFAILISGIAQAFIERRSLSKEQISGGMLAAFAVWLHCNPTALASILAGVGERQSRWWFRGKRRDDASYQEFSTVASSSRSTPKPPPPGLKRRGQVDDAESKEPLLKRRLSGGIVDKDEEEVLDRV